MAMPRCITSDGGRCEKQGGWRFRRGMPANVCCTIRAMLRIMQQSHTTSTWKYVWRLVYVEYMCFLPKVKNRSLTGLQGSDTIMLHIMVCVSHYATH